MNVFKAVVKFRGFAKRTFGSAMLKAKDLRKYDRLEFQKFLDSFDVVLSDCDGVLWYIDAPINNAVETLNRLQSIGKKVFLLSNNSTLGSDYFINYLSKNGFEAKEEQIILPSKVIPWYLKKIGFHEEAFVIASVAFRKSLSDAGIKMIDPDPDVGLERIRESLQTLEGNLSVKAVIIDFDIYCNWAKLALAISYLRRKEVSYIVGATDRWITYSNKGQILGPGSIIDLVSQCSGRNPLICSKPSETLRDCIFDWCKIHDPQRCVLIGDTITHDMEFGSMCNFRKLFVSSGNDALEHAEQSEKTCPDYYLPDLGQLLPILDDFLCKK